ncbi:hypothetical protein CDAR_471981 [Caerostris darwini]|uniref:Uncharacterized protein n=1 Tax=Caerostris darwini TaxID=1538125 RepID=A0AAV4VKY6_9ARAC|nr:hypothetical protein CDAR_471981 [Caerostris darwini]
MSKRLISIKLINCFLEAKNNIKRQEKEKKKCASTLSWEVYYLIDQCHLQHGPNSNTEWGVLSFVREGGVAEGLTEYVNHKLQLAREMRGPRGCPAQDLICPLEPVCLSKSNLKEVAELRLEPSSHTHIPVPRS